MHRRCRVYEINKCQVPQNENCRAGIQERSTGSYLCSVFSALF